MQLFFRFHVGTNIAAPSVTRFLCDLKRHLRVAIVLIWDRLNAHRARHTQGFFKRHPAIHPVYLPPYAPELNPVEDVWSYLKMNPLANYATEHLDELAKTSRSFARSLQRRPSLLHSFFRHSPLPLRLG